MVHFAAQISERSTLTSNDQGSNMSNLQISFMEQSDIPQSAKVLSIAMLNNPNHIGILLGNGEKQRQIIEKMFVDLFSYLPGVVFLAREDQTIIGVMRMKSCIGKVIDAPDVPEDENNIDWRKSVWFKEWSKHDPDEQHWHLGPIGVLPTHQGAGIGSLLMERFCKEVDACMAKAYLETDLDQNVRFYEKFGFKVVSESEIFGVKNRYMLRDEKNRLDVTTEAAPNPQ